MEYSIVFSSQTGNTALLAQTARDTLPKESCRYFGAPAEDIPDSPLIFCGFWTDKGGCDEQAKRFLTSLQNRKIFLFGTAGFGGSEEYYAGILSRVRENIPTGNTVVGEFMCQGRMPDTARQRYEKMLAQAPGDQKLMGMLENFEKATSHPDADDLANFAAAVKSAVSKY